MKKMTFTLCIALLAAPVAAAAAPCDPSCPTCQNAINTFQKQAQETLAVATPPNPQNEVNSDTCLGNALNFSLSDMFPSSVSSLIQQLEKEVFQAACSAASSAISNTVSKGNSLLNFNLPANEFSQLTGMSSFNPVQITSNSGGSSGITFQNSSPNIWSNAATTAVSNGTGEAASQVNNWYNNVLP
ncbi:MAG: hypothetical protein M1492_01525 [Gammaproteobacteria bacterium]|jgi:hypothetical protein|nr:hypothetical protein [Gammaproteobacteria bacterium]